MDIDIVYQDKNNKKKSWIELTLGLFIIITLLLFLFFNDLSNVLNYSKTKSSSKIQNFSYNILHVKNHY